jgi:hypothetical protein
MQTAAAHLDALTEAWARLEEELARFGAEQVC